MSGPGMSQVSWPVLTKTVAVLSPEELSDYDSLTISLLPF